MIVPEVMPAIKAVRSMQTEANGALMYRMCPSSGQSSMGFGSK
jgi:hypothetical protein